MEFPVQSSRQEEGRDLLESPPRQRAWLGFEDSRGQEGLDLLEPPPRQRVWLGFEDSRGQDWPSRRRAVRLASPRSPKALVKGSALEDASAPSMASSEICDNTELRLSATPKRSVPRGTSPPSLLKRRKRCDAEIDMALRERSGWLLSLALSWSHRCGRGSHGVLEAVRRRNLQALGLLLSEGGEGIDAQCHGHRAIHEALQDDLMMELLLKHGANPNPLPGDRNGEGPLHIAVRHCNSRAVLLLLEHGADPNGMAASGRSAWHILCEAPAWDRRLVARQLINHGANPVLPDSAGRRPSACAQDASTRATMSEAESIWSGFALRLVQGSVSKQGVTSWLLPEVADAIGGFL